MLNRCSLAIVLVWLVGTYLSAQEPNVLPFSEGWQRVVKVPMAELGEGDRYIVWVEDGWLQGRREAANGVTDWHIVLAEAIHSTPPDISAPVGTVRFEVSYAAGRYFVREDANVLRSVRQRKLGDNGSYTLRKRFHEPSRPAGSAGSSEQSPMLQGWSGENGYVITSSMGPTVDRADCLVRLSPLVKNNGFGYEHLQGSSLKRAFYGENCWLLDDGELLIAQRTLAAGVLGDVGVGDRAPLFDVMTLNGKSLKLEQFRGKYVLLDFWATWCVPCIAEMPELKKVYQEFGTDDRLVMIGLSLDVEADDPKKFVETQSISWIQGCIGANSDNRIAKDYGISTLPSIFLIDPDGKIVARGMRGKKIVDVVTQTLRKN